MKKKNLYNDECTISTTKGVVLMVAITFILAGVIAVFVFNNTGIYNQNYLITATAEQVSTNNIDVTYHGGPYHDSIDWINISVDNTFEHQELNPAVGYTWTSVNGSTDRNHVIVVGHFMDGNEHVILNTYV